MEEVVILVGTETGNAEDVADELAAALEEVGVEAEIVDMEDAEPDLLDGSRAVIICTATHGDGELPENSIELYETLEEERPDLSGVLFAVCALGDSVYPDFCEAGRIWSRFLTELGATEVIERHEIDGFPEEEDFEGAREWVQEAAERFREPALAAVVSGDGGSYAVGRYGGGKAIRWLEGRLAWYRAERAFERWGSLAILLTRFLVTPLALPTNLIAGGGRYAFRWFLLLSALGNLVWIAVYGGLGYLFAGSWRVVGDLAGSMGGWLALFALVAVGAYEVYARCRCQVAPRPHAAVCNIRWR